MGIAWAQIEDAVHTWLAGEPPVEVIWTGQAGPYPDYPFFSITPTSFVPVHARPEVTRKYDGARPLGQEIERRARTIYELVLSVQAYQGPEKVLLGQGSAMAMLMGAQTRLGLPSVRQALRAVGLVVFEPGAVRNLTALFQTASESRAQADVRCWVVDFVSEYSGYLASIGLTLNVPPVTIQSVISAEE